MNQKTLVIVLIVSIVVVVTGGYLALTRNKLPYNPPTEIPEDWLQGKDNNTPTPAPDQKTPSTQPTKSGAKSSFAYDEAKAASCVANYRSQQQKYNQEVSRGEILVGFPAGTSADTGKEIIRSHNLTSQVPPSGFHFYLFAYVPTGEEFLWACRLSQDGRIRYAEPNYIAQAQTVSPN